MIRNLARTIFTLIFICGTAVCIAAQGDSTTADGKPRKEDLPIGIKESLAKQRIAREKKDFAELVLRGEEALKLSNDLEKSFTENNQLSVEDKKKIDRLEKVIKKIRNEIGADDDESIEFDNKSLSVLSALKALQNNTEKLVGELKKSTRYSISVVAVESSNMLLKVVRFLRLGKN
jgi:membrane-associated HD superfamily phosphohydrolase